jgi:cytochrome c-type biogenesis protein CcmH/NrfG
MGWFLAIGLALIVAAAVIRLGRLPRATWELLGAALLLGLAGYAWQGNPGLAGSPRSGEARTAAFDEKMIERRRALAERFGKSAQWLTLSDGLGRQGKTREAANVLVSGLRESPDDPNLWLGLANALVVHGDGILSPSAEFAFRRALALDSVGPATPYFYGLALARSGRLDEARGQWAPLAARLPAGSGLRAELQRNLAAIDQAQALGAQ